MSAIDARSAIATPPSRSTWVTDRLREEILSGELAPGAPLVPAELAKRLGVSQTPLREAISALASEGLAVTSTHRSAQVAPLSLRELRELYDLGIVLVSLALRRSLECANDRWRSDVERAYRDLETEVASTNRPFDAFAHEQAHRRFNRTLRSRCDFDWLLRVLELLTDHGARYRAHTWQIRPVPGLDQYRVLYDAAMAGDVEATIVASARELSSVCAAIERTLLDQGYEDDPGLRLGALSSQIMPVALALAAVGGDCPLGPRSTTP